MDDSLNVLVCHEAPLIGSGITAMLRRHADITVTPCPGDAETAWRNGRFDVVVADYASGLKCAVAAGSPGGGPRTQAPRVLIVTGQASEWEIRHAVVNGVHGYLLQDCAGSVLEHAVRSVARGARCFDDVVSSRMADSLLHAALTRRELEVLQLLARGCGNKTIALRLDIAVGTVKAHIKAILGKLNVRTRTQAAAVAEERGLLRVPLPPGARPAATHGTAVRTPGAGQPAEAAVSPS